MNARFSFGYTLNRFDCVGQEGFLLLTYLTMALYYGMDFFNYERTYMH